MVTITSMKCYLEYSRRDKFKLCVTSTDISTFRKTGIVKTINIFTKICWTDNKLTWCASFKPFHMGNLIYTDILHRVIEKYSYFLAFLTPIFGHKSKYFITAFPKVVY